MRRLIALTLLLAVATAVSASAASRIHTSPSPVHRGHLLRVYGHVDGCTGSATLYSTAFRHVHDFAGIAAVYAHVNRRGNFSVKVRIRAKAKPKRYSVGGRCGGGNIGAANFRVSR